MFAADEQLDQATRKIVESDLAIEQRLAKALVELEDSGLGAHDEECVVLRLSQQDLAALTGASLDSVKKIIRGFKSRDIVGTGRGTMIILNSAALRDIARGDLTASL